MRPSKGGAKKLDDDGSSRNVSEQNDDEWTPTAILTEDPPDNELGNDEANVNRKANEISFKITNPDGTERRMTKREKKQLKYKLAQAKREGQREKRQMKHEQLIQEAKKAKRERKAQKRLARQEKKQQQQQQQPQQKEDEQEHIKQSHEQVSQKTSCNDECEEKHDASEGPTFTSYSAIDEELAAMRGERSGIPPAMLAPAAACVALDMKALECTNRKDPHIRTIFDRQMTREWAHELQQNMILAEELRAQEDMRPMAYKIVPELWNRLCPNSLWECKDEDVIKSQVEPECMSDKSTMNVENQHSLGLIRHPSQLYDEVTYAVFHHIHQHSNLHISSGGIFGCDFLLYDGKREDRHSFAGLRIYTCDKEKDESKFPVPSAYDLTGFVRTMNTARKLALIATVIKDEVEGGNVRVLIVDLALEKILSVETHKKKGNTEKRRSEKETSSGLAKMKS